MLWYSYLYENTMFTNKMRHSIIVERKMLEKQGGEEKG